MLFNSPKVSANSRPSFLLLLLHNHSNFCSLFLFFLPLFSHLHNLLRLFKYHISCTCFAMAPIDLIVPTCPNLLQLLLTYPNLPKHAQTCPNLAWLSLVQFGLGNFPKPMHWSLLRICLRAR